MRTISKKNTKKIQPDNASKEKEAVKNAKELLSKVNEEKIKFWSIKFEEFLKEMEADKIVLAPKGQFIGNQMISGFQFLMTKDDN